MFILGKSSISPFFSWISYFHLREDLSHGLPISVGDLYERLVLDPITLDPEALDLTYLDHWIYRIILPLSNVISGNNALLKTNTFKSSSHCCLVVMVISSKIIKNGQLFLECSSVEWAKTWAVIYTNVVHSDRLLELPNKSTEGSEPVPKTDGQFSSTLIDMEL